jgi:hypothetical protein
MFVVWISCILLLTTTNTYYYIIYSGSRVANGVHQGRDDVLPLLVAVAESDFSPHTILTVPSPTVSSSSFFFRNNFLKIDPTAAAIQKCQQQAAVYGHLFGTGLYRPHHGCWIVVSRFGPDSYWLDSQSRHSVWCQCPIQRHVANEQCQNEWTGRIVGVLDDWAKFCGGFGSGCGRGHFRRGAGGNGQDQVH